MIVLDTTVLVYAKGADHPLRQPSRSLLEAVAAGTVQATTTPEVIQEFVHVRARRRPRRDAAELGRSLVELLSPLLTIEEHHLLAGLLLFDRHPRLGPFDAVLAAAAIASGAEALLSADRTFSDVRGIRHVVPGTMDFDRLLGSSWRWSIATRRIREGRREPVGFREGYQGKAAPAGAKPVKSAAAGVPSKPSNNASPKQSK